MENRRRSKRIDDQSLSPRRSKRIENQSVSPVAKKHNAEDKSVRQIRSDIAKLDEKLSSIVRMIPDAKEISTRLSSLERKFDSIGRVVYGGKPKIQKIVEDVENIRSDNIGNTNLMLDLSVTKDRSDSLCNVIHDMQDTLRTIAEAQGIHLEASNYPSAMDDHVRRMVRRLQNTRRTHSMSIKTYAQEMKTLHQEICNHGGDKSKKFLKTNFINGLGKPFENIYMNLLHGNLPPEWQPMDIDELVPVAENYLNEKPSASSRKRKYSDSDDDSH